MLKGDRDITLRNSGIAITLANYHTPSELAMTGAQFHASKPQNLPVGVNNWGPFTPK